MSDLHARLRALAAAAVLQRVRWHDRAVDVPLAQPHRVDHDEVVLRLADGGWLVLAVISNVTALRAALRRWARETEDGEILALILADSEVESQVLEAPPERENARMTVALLQEGQALWDRVWPRLADILEEAADRRSAPPESVLTTLREREGASWPERTTPPPTPAFERLVFALAQAHDLVRLVRGEAELRLRTGDSLTVLATSGDPSIDDAAMASALARMAASLSEGDQVPGLILVEHEAVVEEGASASENVDLQARIRQVLGAKTRLGRINTVRAKGGVQAPDPELAQLARLSDAWEGDIDLFSLLETGLSRANGRRVDRGADAAGDERLGLVRWLLTRVPGAKLGWIERRGAELRRAQSALRIHWVGPGGGPVDEALARWRLAAIAARWTGQTVDLLLAGGDSATWERIRDRLGGAPEGHVFHLDADGGVRAKAGLFGRLRPAARALRGLSKAPAAEQRCTLDELKHELDRSAEADFRSTVMDRAFVERLGAVTPWATRGILAIILLVYVLQLRWDVADAYHQSAGALLVRMGALTGDGLWPILTSEPWRLLSSSFLHASWWHIGLNAYALWILGRRLESMLGPERLILLYVASCLGGSVLHEAVSGGGGGLAVGASTGVLGLLAAQGALTLFKPELMPDRIRRLLWREAWMNGLLIGAISLLPFVGGLLHLGGAITGFALVATGLFTRGLSAPGAFDTGPTQIHSPPWLRPIAAGVGALAVGAAVAGIAFGQAWELNSATGRVQEQSFFEGRLELPVPPGSVNEKKLPDGSLVVTAGDLFEDGLRVRYTARRVAGADSSADLEDVVAVYGDGAFEWSHQQVGGQVAAQLFDVRAISTVDWEDLRDLAWSGSDELSAQGFVEQRWMVVDDGVVVDLSVKALPDAADTRLGGKWTRLPAGIRIGEGWDTLPADDGLEAFRRARAGEADETDPMLFAIATAAADRDRARNQLDKSLASDGDALGRAARLSAVTDGEASVLLAGRALAQAPRRQRSFLRSVYVSALLDDDRDDEAARESKHPLSRSQAYWYAGRDADAKAAASEWRSSLGIDVWLGLSSDAAAAHTAGNLAWADLLSGDAERCMKQSRLAAQNHQARTAALNVSICALAAGEQREAEIALRDPLEEAVKLGDRRLLSGILNDLDALAERDIPGAEAIRAQVAQALPRVPPQPLYEEAGERP